MDDCVPPPKEARSLENQESMLRFCVPDIVRRKLYRHTLLLGVGNHGWRQKLHPSPGLGARPNGTNNKFFFFQDLMAFTAFLGLAWATSSKGKRAMVKFNGANVMTTHGIPPKKSMMGISAPGWK